MHQIKENKKKLLCLLALILVIVAAGFGVDFFCQRGVLGLSEEEKGEHVLHHHSVWADGFDHTDAGWQFEDDAGRIVISTDGRYIDRFVMEYQCDRRLDLEWTIYLTGQEEPWILEDNNGLFISRTSEWIGGQVDRVELFCQQAPEETEKMDLFITEFSILNEYERNWYRILFVWILLGLAAFVILGWKWIASHMAQAYLIAALTIGGTMILLSPANKVGWDEEVHFFHAYCVSHFGAEVKTNDILEKLFVADDENWPYSQPANRDEREQMNEALNTMVETQPYDNNRGRALAGLYTPAYIPSAIGIRLGLMLDLPFTAVYQLGRVFNLIFCVAIMAWAIHVIPAGKAILTMIGLLPTPLFLMAVYSYDPFITALFALGFALFLREYRDKEKKLSWQTFAVMSFSFTVGSLPKAIYVPMILMIWLLPGTKFADRKEERLVKGIVLALFIALMASFVLPVVISPAESNDLRGGNTSEAGQIPYILSDIPRFIRMMVYSIRTTFAGFTIGAAVYGSLGHLGLEMLGMVIPLFVLGVIFADEKWLGGDSYLTWPHRLWILFLSLIVMAMVWLAMYLAFTPVGSNTINGVQARYYIPLLLPVYLCLCPDRVKVKIGKEVLYPATLACGMVVTLVTVERCMLGLCG